MNTENRVENLYLNEQELISIKRLVEEIKLEFNNEVEEFAFLSQSVILSQKIPRRIRKIFYDFKLNEPYLGILVKNGKELFDNFPPTPIDYIEKPNQSLLLNDQDIVHGLFSSLLGEPFSFETQRWGHIFNSIMAKKELEDVANNSSGSHYAFAFHSEDAFHPGAPDYLGLVSIRNNEKAPTTISSLQGIELPLAVKKALFAHEFLITSNDIHKNVIEPINQQRKSILFGDFNDPYLRMNENTININDYQGIQKEALIFLLTQLHKNKIEIILESGYFLYIDNLKTVHRRDSYIPNMDLISGF